MERGSGVRIMLYICELSWTVEVVIAFCDAPAGTAVPSNPRLAIGMCSTSAVQYLPVWYGPDVELAGPGARIWRRLDEPAVIISLDCTVLRAAARAYRSWCSSLDQRLRALRVACRSREILPCPAAQLAGSETRGKLKTAAILTSH